MQGNFFLLVPIVMPAVAGLMAPYIDSRRLRNAFIMLILLAVAAACGAMAFVPDLGSALLLFRITPQLPVLLRLDGLGKLFTVLISCMWALVGLFSFEYTEHDRESGRFYAFYMLSLAMLMGLSLSANLPTMYMFYELMTLLSLPLVLHERTKQSIAAGIKYLLYSVFGASCGLMGIFAVAAYAPTMLFYAGGTLSADSAAAGNPLLMTALFVMLLGFGVKAGMFPFHGWLPTAHPVAPAPASAVLSGVITKAGVLCVIRVVFYLFGADFLRGTWVQWVWMGLTLATVFMGSMLALKENVLKKRLAYSTVSQVSYVLFGLSTLTATGFVGALMHVVFHSIIKNALFLSAGAIIHQTGKTHVDELDGMGKRMPVVMWCYTLAACALIGIPPTGGFVSKWYLAQGGLSLGTSQAWVGPVVLLVSAVLTAGYLLPVTIRGFLPGEGFDYASLEKAEPSWRMTLPLILLAAAALLLGMFPGVLINLIQSIAGSVL